MTWEKVRLGDVSKLVTGKTPPTGETEYFDGGITWVNPSDFGTKYIEESKRTVSIKAVNDKKCNVLPSGTILLSCIGDIGKVGILKEQGTTNQQITGLILGEKVFPEYLYYFLILNKSKLENLANKAVVAILNNERLKEFQIPLPPLPIQKRIAEILDTADALRRKDEALLKKYDELAQAIFIDMFGDPVKNEKGWEVKTIIQLCAEVIDCPHSTPSYSDKTTNYPCIRTSEMKKGKINWESMKYLNTDEYLLRVRRLKPQEGDIVYAREGTYGEAVLLPENYNFALGQRTMLLRPNVNEVDNVFLWFQINSDFVYQQAKRKNMGSTVGHVNVADVKQFNILYPPLELQKKFGELILKLKRVEQSHSIVKSNNLFNSLLQKAFNGELVK